MTVSTEHIAIVPGKCGGKPHIAGHRVKVSHLAVLHEDHGLTPAQIVEQIPTITLADVFAALAYYHDHRDAIRAEIAADEQFVEELFRGQPSLSHKLGLNDE